MSEWSIPESVESFFESGVLIGSLSSVMLLFSWVIGAFSEASFLIGLLSFAEYSSWCFVLTSRIHELAWDKTPSKDLRRDIRHSWRARASWRRFDDSSESLRCVGDEVADEGWRGNERNLIEEFYSAFVHQLINKHLKLRTMVMILWFPWNSGTYENEKWLELKENQ